MQSFIVEHHLGEVIDVYCGGPDIFNGKVKPVQTTCSLLNRMESTRT